MLLTLEEAVSMSSFVTGVNRRSAQRVGSVRVRALPTFDA